MIINYSIMIIGALLAIGGIVYEIYEYREYSKSPTSCIATAAICVVIGVLMTGGVYWYLNNTEAGKRDIKSWESETTGGINRTVKVYDIEGELIAEYEGEFDVTYDETRILFDDENGYRHVIYFSTATVIIDEVEE